MIDKWIERERERDDTSCREGRRVVELGVLADGLAGCKDCGLPIYDVVMLMSFQQENVMVAHGMLTPS